MKRILISICLMISAGATQAATLNVSTGNKPFKTFDGILSDDIVAASKPLKAYMKKNMGCSQVDLDLNVLKEEGLFHDGIYELSMKANCDASITDLKLDFDAMCSEEFEGEAGLSIEYMKAGQHVFKRFMVPDSGSCQE